MKHRIITLLCLAVLSASVCAQPSGAGDPVVRKAMKDELARNMKRLKLDALNPPFFIAYTVRDVERTTITASMGSLVLSESGPRRDFLPRLMVGDYQRNDENFVDLSSRFGGSGGMARFMAMPLEDDYYGIRRALWLQTDEMYKSAADTYEKKNSAIEQQNLLKELADLPDFSKETPQQIHIDGPAFSVDTKMWEDAAREISAEFLKYPDIQSSRVSISFLNAMVYSVNSEGTDVSYPITLASMQIFAKTQAQDGEILDEQIAFYGVVPSALPGKQAAVKAAAELAEALLAKCEAEPFKDSYTGPVLFEGQAVAELVSQRLFLESDGLIASRTPVSTSPQAAMMSSGSTLEDRIGKRLLPDEFTLSAQPRLKEYKGTPCIGAYSVDAEGVPAPENLALISEGKLETLLNDRVPSKKVRQSNGHRRIGLTMESGVAPGVIRLASSKTSSAKEMKAALLKAAKDEGLKYAVIVRKITSPTLSFEQDINFEDVFTIQFGGKKETSIAPPLQVYKVDVETGKETAIRSIEFGGIPVSSLRDIVSAEDKDYVHNTLTNPSSGGNMGFFISLVRGASGLAAGYPSTFIVPNALLFSELEMKKSEKSSTPKLPIVSSPLSGE